MCSQRLMKFVLRCQNQDALRSALGRPATSQTNAGSQPPVARAAYSAKSASVAGSWLVLQDCLRLRGPHTLTNAGTFIAANGRDVLSGLLPDSQTLQQGARRPADLRRRRAGCCRGPLQMNWVGHFHGIVSDKCSEELESQKRLSLPSWNAGPRRGGVTRCLLGSFAVIVVQEAEPQEAAGCGPAHPLPQVWGGRRGYAMV